MSTIIDMLEKLGQDANLQTPEALKAAKADLAEQIRTHNQPMNFIVVVADEDTDTQQTGVANELTQEVLEETLNLDSSKCILVLPADDDDESEGDNTEEKNLKAA
ncbi:hypothetical protein GCM10011369_03260 [Neiella marina]|uniref:Uncharacterized protein n=1 Tax=Neiella marina TaxID=508461 RepID=A0A8J2U222_9GAMM|nr:hypothetical protein [Neiella marina]GGA65180.1 hypothetical protein GCM10011369_03260 [Neiella marina]